ncbi:MAG: hypothetical protein HYU36_13210 [Planctomycetes bacterium]|nr:hypothetical protein [Planctomycetota bacterium]
MKSHGFRLLAFSFMLPTLYSVRAQDAAIEPWRHELYSNWKKLPEPPITPYDGPFGERARAFIGKTDLNHPDKAVAQNWLAQYDWTHTAKGGVYDPKKDPRPINTEFEAAVLDDWNRMGYNCAYKGNYFTFMVGSFLKERGLLGAIDQTLFGQNGPPPLQFDGKEGSRQREACGSFFHPENYRAGVDAITGMGHYYGHHLFTVNHHRITCSWDEVGMRTRAQMDYRDPMRTEFRKFLREIWFGDQSPGQDSNGDGRTYNGFTGENLAKWEEVEPLHVSLDWTVPGWSPDGARTFSQQPDVDRAIFDQPGRYKLLIDFHRYFTFEFFRRINEEASQNMNRLGTPGRVTCYPFVQHFIIWPGANQRHGNSFYWYHRLGPVVNVEHCWPEAPVMNLNYAITDRLAPRFQNVVMGWIWFYFGNEGYDMYNGPHDIDRAMARMMGHVVDGTHHWLYSPRYRSRDKAQRLQIAYWQNFLKLHYRTFLSKSALPAPEIALLMPDYTGYFYRMFQYPKQDWGWTPEAFQNLQYGYHILTEEELELDPKTLEGYKALYVVGSEWTTPTIRERVADFIRKGGVVFANVDSLTLDIPAGRRTDFLERTFGVKLVHRYKNCFYPSTQSVEEAVWALAFDQWGGPFKLQGHKVHELDDPRAWASLYQRTPEKVVTGEDGKPKQHDNGQPVRHPDWKMVRDEKGRLVRDEEVWKQLDAAMAGMPKEVRGIAQSPLDMRTPPEIRYAPEVTGAGPAPSWSEVDVAVPGPDARPVAWWGDRVCGIETDRTVWLGIREGMNLHAISSRLSAHRATEPCNPFPAEIPESYEAHRPYAEALGYAARKAGVTRAVTLTRGGRLPCNLEVLPRVDEKGTWMVIAINHDSTDATYQVEFDPGRLKGLKSPLAWNLLREEAIESDTDGRFDLVVVPWGVSVFLVGETGNLAEIRAAQAELNRKDLSVPKYFVDRPALNEGEWGTPIPPIGD